MQISAIVLICQSQMLYSQIFSSKLMMSLTLSYKNYRKDLFYHTFHKYSQFDYQILCKNISYNHNGQQIKINILIVRNHNMSFVIPRSQKQPIFSQQTDYPGPGAYLKVNTKKNIQHCAPFNNSELKTSIFDVQKTNYGPGSYQPKHKKQINKPIKTISNSHMFISRIDRFHNGYGPNSQKIALQQKQLSNDMFIKNKSLYTYETKKQYTSQTKLHPNYAMMNRNNEQYKKKLEKSKQAIRDIRENNNKKKVQSIKNNKDFVRVILASTTNTETHVNQFYQKGIMGKTLGPGSYDNSIIKSKPKNVAKWEKEKPNRFLTDANDVPGPGSYENITYHNKLRKNGRLSASFACSEMRSHIDSMIYRTNIPLKADIIQKKKLKDNSPGPGSYDPTNIHKDKKSFNHSVHGHFGSQNKSFLGKQQKKIEKESVPGPGYYECGNIIHKSSKNNETIKQIRNQLFGKKKAQKNLKRSQILKNPQNKYDPQFTKGKLQRKNNLNHKVCSLEERCFSKLGNLPQEQRFKKTYNEEPGPGQYKYECSEQIVAPLNKNKSSVFRSETKRDIFNCMPSQSLSQFYNINKNDIGYKAQKMKKYIENLKKINIQRTPFQSGAQRFKQNKLQIDEDQHSPEIMSNTRNYIKKQVKVYKPNLPSSSFISQSKRDVFVYGKIKSKSLNKNRNKDNQEIIINQTFLDDECSPGPGQYDIKSNYQGKYCDLEKKSFNRNYNPTLQKNKKQKRAISQFQQNGQNFLARSKSTLSNNCN